MAAAVPPLPLPPPIDPTGDSTGGNPSGRLPYVSYGILGVED
jgi:hypothetical protein